MKKIEIIPTVFCLFFFLLFISLGFWQLERAEEKKILLKSYEKGIQTAPLSKLPETISENSYMPVSVSGYFLNEQQFLLDNQFYQHEMGYRVLTLVKIPNQTKFVLIDRGWILGDITRKSLPYLPPRVGLQNVRGIAYRPSKKGILLGPIENNPGDWPRVIEKIDLEQIEKIVNKPILPFIIVLNQNQPQSFTRIFTPATLPPARHLGYAFQWFCLAILSIIVFFAYHLRK